MSLSKPLRQQLSKLMAQNTQKCLVMSEKITKKLLESPLVEDGMSHDKEIDRSHDMTDELKQQKAFLTWEESVAILQTDASQGIARAQRLLAMRYQRGRGVPKDEAIAFYWMQFAAQQNFAMAQRSLGELYENGSGIALDISVASDWYRLAALQGDSIAKQHLQRLAQTNT
jgi:TPR repeat protein